MKKKIFVSISILIVVVILILIWYYWATDTTTKSTGIIDVSVEGKPINASEVMVIFSENDEIKPITVENIGDTINFNMNTWDKSTYRLKVIVNKNVLDKDELGNGEINHIFEHFPANEDMNVTLEMGINYYKKDGAWYVDIEYSRSDPQKYTLKEKLSLKDCDSSFLCIGP